MSPNIPANVLRRFFIVSSASSVSAALREPCRANPPRAGVEPALGGAAVGAVLLVVLGAADAEDTVEAWDAVNGKCYLLQSHHVFTSKFFNGNKNI